MNITGWPFAIEVEGDVEGGSTATITIDVAKPLSDDVHTKMRYAVESFVALAEAGGLGGDRVPPERSKASLSESPPPPGGTHVVWELTTLAIDARGLGVLFNMLVLLVDGIQGVSVQARGKGSYPAFRPEEPPPAWEKVPFDVDDDRTEESVELNIEFRQPLTDAQGWVILDALEAWLDCGSVQGYRDWESSADDSFLAPADDPPFDVGDSSVSAQLADSGVLEGCYDTLTNVLIRLHATVPVESLELV